MKLFATFAALALGLEIEQGGKWGQTECINANKFIIERLGNSSDVEVLTQFNAEKPTEGYKLEGNVVEILADKNNRKLMGRLVCSQDGTKLSSEDITGSIQFKNLPNALTNLDGDVNKRIECEAIGYPLPSLKWRFQAIDEEAVEGLCDGGKCTVCTSNCHPEEDVCKQEDSNAKEACVSQFYQANSTDIFSMGINDLAVRFSNKTCPMSGELSEAEALDCKTVLSTAEVENLPINFAKKSQLLFSDVSYAQGGKYICVATQEDVVRTKAFVWRVKDPMAALWPFLGLVVEVMVVVAAILYYEKKSAKGNEEEETNDEEAAKLTK
ncbi:unnamed protein product [Oikopleura dioica]|uniref:Basigin n=1 Tax=Oikopleura dioica TaxID=34765 RepID=E4X6M9_OIKDI|nr:unnamed protein product [Oikopleura dioica]